MRTLAAIRNAAVKALSLARAIFSLARYGEVTPITYELRRAECLDCDQKTETDRGVFCAACGCPQWFMSDLRTKTRLIDVKCPLNKW